MRKLWILALLATVGLVPIMAAADPLAETPDEAPLVAEPDDGLDDPTDVTPPVEDDGADEGAEDTPTPNDVQVRAVVAPDEKSVTITASGAAVAGASSVSFNVWSEAGGQDDIVVHGAKCGDDGLWRAKVYIASKTIPTSTVPYNCRIPNAVHRLYNPYDFQHLYTNDVREADNLVAGGWNYEGIVWIAPDDAAATAPIYRLFNPFNGDHYFTASEAEHDLLVSSGWQSEGVKLHGTDNTGYAVYKLYQPDRASDTHLYTIDANEYETLGNNGWVREGICWYGAPMSEDGAWSASGKATPHNDPGLYDVSAVVTMPTGATVTSSGAPTFYISRPQANVDVTSVDNAHGTFDVTVSAIKSPSGVSAVEVPTWSLDGGQDDLIWYSAEGGPNGTYTATVHADRHNLALSYIAHGYVTTGNGIRCYVGAVNPVITLENYAKVEGGPYEFRVTIYYPGPVSWVKMPSWSSEGGQDDLIWYDATDNGDGTWSAIINARNFKHAGECITHIYADEQYRNAVTYTVDPIALSWSGDLELDWMIDNILDTIGRDGNVLRKAFDYVSMYPYIRTWDTPSGDFTKEYAKEMYRNHGGNCYRYASLFKWIAIRLGYDARVVVGWLPTRSGQEPHGWTEIADNGQWYIYDTEMVQHWPYLNFYHCTYGEMPFTYNVLWRS